MYYEDCMELLGDKDGNEDSDIVYADMMSGLYDDIENFFAKLDIRQKTFEDSANELKHIFLETISNNTEYIYGQVGSKFLSWIECERSIDLIIETSVFSAINHLISVYFIDDDMERNYFQVDFLSNDSIHIKRNIGKAFYGVARTSFVLEVDYEAYVDNCFVEIEEKYLKIAFDLFGVSVELAIIGMLFFE